MIESMFSILFNSKLSFGWWVDLGAVGQNKMCCKLCRLVRLVAALFILRSVGISSFIFITDFQCLQCRSAISANDLHVLRWLRNQSAELQIYYKFIKEMRTSKLALNQQLAQTCCYAPFLFSFSLSTSSKISSVNIVMSLSIVPFIYLS